MAKSINLNEDVRKQLLDVFENLKDEFVPDLSDKFPAALEIIEAIRSNSLTSYHLSMLKGCSKYTQITNILRAAKLNFDLTKYMD